MTRRASTLACHLTSGQRAEADLIEQRPLKLARGDLRALAELLASKPTGQLFGPTEYEVRERVHRIGAVALEVAPDECEK